MDGFDSVVTSLERMMMELEPIKLEPSRSVSGPGLMALLEKWFIRTPGYQYWCRLVTVADTNNGWLTSRYQ
jgi:hypothetical protein